MVWTGWISYTKTSNVAHVLLQNNYTQEQLPRRLYLENLESEIWELSQVLITIRLRIQEIYTFLILKPNFQSISCMTHVFTVPLRKEEKLDIAAIDAKTRV